LHILGSGDQVRHYTYGGDLARGIRLCLESREAINEDFNLSTPVGHTVLELAELVWKRFHPGEALRFVTDEPFRYDVQRACRTFESSDVLAFEARTSLEASSTKYPVG